MSRAKVPKPVEKFTAGHFNPMFPDEDACKAYIVARRWPEGVRCWSQLFNWFRHSCFRTVRCRRAVMTAAPQQADLIQVNRPGSDMGQKQRHPR